MLAIVPIDVINKEDGDENNNTNAKGKTMTKADLTRENEELRSQMEAARNELAALQSYLQSEKFSNDPTVQVRDVLNRLAPATDLLNG